MSTRYALILLAFSLILPSALRAQSGHEADDLNLITERHPVEMEALRVAEPELDVFAKPTDSDRRRHWRDPAMSHLLPKGGPDAWLLALQVSQNWDASANGGQGEWLDEARSSIMRDDVGRQTGLLIEDFDSQTGEWMPSVRQTNTLNDDGRTTERLFEDYDASANGGSGAWTPAQRTRNTYDDQGNIIVNTTELWNQDTQQFDIIFRTTREYDSSGEIVLRRLFESALFGPLAPSIRRTFEYDDMLNLTREFVEAFGIISQEWGNQGLEMYTYDSNGEEIEHIEQDWDDEANGGQGDWVNDARDLTIFTPDSDNPTSIDEIEQEWDAEAGNGAGDWLNRDRELTEYSNSPPQVVETEQEWDPDAPGKTQQGAWINVNRGEEYYDANFNPLELISQSWDAAAAGGNGAWVNEARDTSVIDDRGLITEFLTEEWDGAAWLNEFRLLQEYEDFETPTSTESDELARSFELDGNYPNPFTNETTVRFKLGLTDRITLEIFDVLGRPIRTVMDQNLTPGTYEIRIDASEFAGGFYVYRIQGSQLAATGRMTVLK